VPSRYSQPYHEKAVLYRPLSVDAILPQRRLVVARNGIGSDSYSSFHMTTIKCPAKTCTGGPPRPPRLGEQSDQAPASATLALGPTVEERIGRFQVWVPVALAPQRHQPFEDLLRRFLHRLAAAIHDAIGSKRLFIRITDAGKIGQFAGYRPSIEAFHVS